MTILKKIVLLLTLLFLLPSTGMAVKNRIAVMDFRADGISKEKALRTSELIRTEIVNTKAYTVIERNQMDMVFKEHGIQQTGVIDDAYAIKMGQLLSAQKILIGTVMQLGDSIIISGRIVDIEKGVAEFAVNQSAANENQLLEATRLFCKKLTGTSSQTAEISGTKKKKTAPKSVVASTDTASQDKKTVSTPKNKKTNAASTADKTNAASVVSSISTADKKKAASSVSTTDKAKIACTASSASTTDNMKIESTAVRTAGKNRAASTTNRTKAASTADNSVQTSPKNDQTLWQEFQAKKAHEELDDEIEKEFGE